MLFGGGPVTGAEALDNHLQLQERFAMKRLLMLFAVLVPLSVLSVGCDGQDADPSTEVEQEEQMERMEINAREQAENRPAGSPGVPPKGDQE